MTDTMIGHVFCKTPLGIIVMRVYDIGDGVGGIGMPPQEANQAAWDAGRETALNSGLIARHSRTTTGRSEMMMLIPENVNPIVIEDMVVDALNDHLILLGMGVFAFDTDLEDD
jgi:hypothetical protein